MKRTRSIFTMVGIAVLVTALASSAQDIERRGSTLKVDVDLVLITASVTDAKGRYVRGLGREHFQIWEDKVEQEIQYFALEDVPASIGVLFDVSGSMSGKLAAARDAAAACLNTGNRDDEYFLVEFSSQPEIKHGFTTDISGLQSRLVFTAAQGRTAFFDALYIGLQKVKQGVNARKALLMITDGEDNRSRYTRSDVKEVLKESDVQLFAIGFISRTQPNTSPGRNAPKPRPAHSGRTVISELANLSGGSAFFPDSIEELEDVCASISTQLKHQYVLGYASTNGSQDGKWRNVRVKVNPPEGIVNPGLRWKSGYYAASMTR